MSATTSLKPHLLQRLFYSADRKTSIEINRFFLKTTSQQGTTQLAYDDLNVSTSRNLFFINKIVLNTLTGGDFELGWLSAADSNLVKELLTTRRKETLEFRQRNQNNAQAIDTCNNWLKKAINGERWITYRDVDEFIETHEPSIQYLWTLDTSELVRGDEALITHIVNMRRVNWFHSR